MILSGTEYTPKNWRVPAFEKNVFKPKKTKYCLVIPVINEGGKFQKQIKSLKKYSKFVVTLLSKKNKMGKLNEL